MKRHIFALAREGIGPILQVHTYILHIPDFHWITDRTAGLLALVRLDVQRHLRALLRRATQERPCYYC